MTITFAESCEMQEKDLRLLYSNLTEDSSMSSNLTLSEFISRHGEACSEFFLDGLVSWIVPVVFALVCIVGFFGNLLVIVVVIFYQQMRNTTNILILNLATADLLFIVTCIPPTAIDYAVGWPLDDLWCKIIQYLINVTTYGSVYTLVLLSLDRYLAVVYPVKSISLRTQLNTTIAISATWIFTFTTCVPVYFLYGTKDIGRVGHEENRTICTFDREHYDEIIFQVVVFVTMLALPLLSILWLYMNMLLRLWRGSAATHGPGPARDTRNKCKGKENKMRLTRMIIVVIIAFALCWTPLQVVLLLKSFGVYDIQISGLVIFQIITHCLAYCNSCLNPILYAFFSPNFRSAFRAVSAGGMNPPQFSGARNAGATFGSVPANNYALSSRWKNRRRTEAESADIERPLQVDKVELQPVAPTALVVDAENFQIQNKDEDKEWKMELLNLPLSEDNIKRRHSCYSSENIGIRVGSNLTPTQLSKSSRRNSITDVKDFIRNSLELKTHRACFAVAHIDTGNKCTAKVQLTQNDTHIHL